MCKSIGGSRRVEPYCEGHNQFDACCNFNRFHEATCPECGGRGFLPLQLSRTVCHRCDGQGLVNNAGHIAVGNGSA